MDKITGFNKFRSPNNYFEFKENIIDEEIIKRMEENILYTPECVINCIKNKINYYLWLLIYETMTYYLLLKEE